MCVLDNSEKKLTLIGEVGHVLEFVRLKKIPKKIGHARRFCTTIVFRYATDSNMISYKGLQIRLHSFINSGSVTAGQFS